MDAVVSHTPMPEAAEAVRVGVVLATNPENTHGVVIDAEGGKVGYKSTKKEETRSFTFDQVLTADDVESLHSELLQPLPESISRGLNGALLTCGASTEVTGDRTDQRIIRKVLTDLFSCLTSRATAELFTTVSFLQFFPDGSAMDLLNFNRESLKLAMHPVLGSVVAGSCEVCVCSAEEALNMYETCRETMKIKAGPLFSRCSFLLSATVEWKLHPEQEESDVCCSKLQLFSLGGGASRTDLRGVNPLVKVLDQILNSSATESDSLLVSLLKDSLTGNSRAFLVYCINPQGPLDDETPHALDLSQKVRGFVTKTRSVQWNPKATEREIRQGITALQNTIMTQGEGDIQSIYKLAGLTENLQMVKRQSWEKRRDESEKIKVRIQSCKSWNSSPQPPAGRYSEQRERTETVKYLQEQLRREMENYIREGKGSGGAVQEKVTRIQQLKEALREETLKSGAVSGKPPLCPQSQLEHNEAQERRRQLKEDHARLIQEEVVKMEADLAREQPPTESPERELLVLSRERRVLVLQIEALRAEAQQAERDFLDQNQRHQTELQRLREESLQVFRVFRQVSEEQRRISEGRYTSVLLDAVQDAVYLSAQNQQLQADNKQLRKALGGIKDTLAARGDPIADLISQQE